ncbi:interleukin-21 [Pempheris klunzingeri]|uniref:interleukin-21 n=1 Tax=Pempheris klunzingeri TaxID=3127111 RepID=UPI003980C498
MNMKLVVLCLLAVCCSSLANTSTNRSDESLKMRKLHEILKQLKSVKNSLQHNGQMLNTPPQNIEDCCCLSALQCFRANLQVQFNTTERTQSTNKLYRSLTSSITERGLDFCKSGNVKPTCQDCDSHPKENVKEFFKRLESLIQRAITRLSMN